MKKLLFVLIIFPFNLYSYYYNVKDFSLSGNVNKVSVVCHDISFEDGEYVEGFPYSSQGKYHTDLNLHYLEFNKDGDLIRSRLFYPRGSYGQFQWLEPQFNLEDSDFGIKKNYLTVDNRYKYKFIEDKLYLTIKDSLSEYTLIIDQERKLIEDAYYSYNYNQNDNLNSVLKKRKGSFYNYRRKETTTIDNITIHKEFINNRFLQAKRVITKNTNGAIDIYISQSKIVAKKEELKNGVLVSDTSVNLSWRNKINPWPEIDFNQDIGFEDFMKSIKRDIKPIKTIYSYNEEKDLIKIEKYEVNQNREKLIAIEERTFENNQLIEVVLITDPLGGNYRRYKTYKNDENGNWYEKVVGEEIYQAEKLVRVPNKRYVKTLTYWN